MGSVYPARPKDSLLYGTRLRVVPTTEALSEETPSSKRYQKGHRVAKCYRKSLIAGEPESMPERLWATLPDQAIRREARNRRAPSQVKSSTVNPELGGSRELVPGATEREVQALRRATLLG